MPDGSLRDCDWRVSAQKQSDFLRLSSSTEIYSTSVSSNRQTRQEWNRASGAWSLKNVRTVSRLKPPTWGKPVCVFRCASTCTEACELVSICKKSLCFLCMNPCMKAWVCGMGNKVCIVSSAQIYISELEVRVHCCLWTSLQRYIWQLLSLTCTLGHDCNTEVCKWQFFTNNKHTYTDIKYTDNDENLVENKLFTCMENPNECIPLTVNSL